jgi:hypothetical protein
MAAAYWVAYAAPSHRSYADMRRSSGGGSVAMRLDQGMLDEVWVEIA